VVEHELRISKVKSKSKIKKILEREFWGRYTKWPVAWHKHARGR